MAKYILHIEVEAGCRASATELAEQMISLANANEHLRDDTESKIKGFSVGFSK